MKLKLEIEILKCDSWFNKIIGMKFANNILDTIQIYNYITNLKK